MPSSTGPVKSSFGDRRLAAIVFTDVASFSALMEANESRTMMLVQRDLKMIGEVCRRFGGDVLKNTGDGCLATFSSVEAAVGSAIKIQRIVADARVRLPPEEILHHRIGIHLGDVFLGQGDVLGNGVNIAARLLGEAEPDGICISQTVYDLVKHRLDVKAICIGPRELKNIRAAVQVYRLVLEAVAGEVGTSVSANKTPRRVWPMAAASFFVLVAIGIGACVIIRSGKWSNSNSAATTALTPTTSFASASQPVMSAIPSTGPTTNLPILRVPQQKPDFTFDSAASWRAFPVFTREFLETAIQDNAYVMTAVSNSNRPLFSVSPWGAVEDVTIQVTARIHGPPLSSWGLQLQSVQGEHKLVRIMISSGGMLKVDLTRLSGVDLNNVGLSPANFLRFPERSIHRANDPNTMLLDIHDHKLSVAVNGQRFGTAWDISTLGPMTVVLMADGVQGTTASFDRVQVWLPHPANDQHVESTLRSNTQ